MSKTKEIKTNPNLPTSKRAKDVAKQRVKIEKENTSKK